MPAGLNHYKFNIHITLNTDLCGMAQAKRKVKVAVISDVHLGFIGCRAKELDKYLESIEPEILIINGDFIDIWQFRSYYFPKSHTKVLEHVFKLVSNGVKVYY